MIGFDHRYRKNIINMRTSLISILIIALFATTCSQSYCPLLPNCAKCLVPTICKQCDPSYTLIQNRCQLLPSKSGETGVPSRQSLGAQRRSLFQAEQLQDGQEGRPEFIHFGSGGSTALTPCILEWKGLCLMCGSAYEMGYGGICIERLDKCVIYSGLMCQKCDSRFATEDGQCIDRGCQNRNYYHCSSCKPGFVLTKNQNCEVEGCLSYQSGVCTKCSVNKTLVEQTCIQQISNCKKQTLAGCTQCRDGYSLQQGRCRISSPLCSRYQNQTDRCVECKYKQLSLVKGACVDANCIDSHPRSGVCLACAVGYKLNENQVCVPVFQDEHCRRVGVNKCIQCEDGYYVGPQARCLMMPPNCIDSACKYCKKGYISYENQCVALSNCDVISGNACQTCASGYSLTLVSTCIKTVGACMQYSMLGCTKCPPNYNLQNMNCVLNRTYVDVNCNAQNLKRECILCKRGYRLVSKYNNLCIMVSTQCKTTNNNGQCSSCYDGYKLNENVGDCELATPIPNCAVQVNDKCQTCSNRYYLVSATLCKPVDPLCKDYEKELGYCLSCYEGYFLLDNLCKPFNTIITPSATTSSVRPSISNCRISDPQNSLRCLECYDSYYLEVLSGNCLKANSQCKTYNKTNGACLTCYDGYQLKDKNCQIATAASPSPSNNSSIGCKRVDPLTARCLECVDRYVKSGQVCIEVSSLCNDYDKTTGGCTSCYPGYMLAVDQCIHASAENCDEVDETQAGVCRKCAQGFYLKEGKCEKVSILCSRSNYKGECITCIQGYFKNSENVCIMPALGWDAGCVKYDNGGYCLQCKPGLKLINFVCG